MTSPRTSEGCSIGASLQVSWPMGWCLSAPGLAIGVTTFRGPSVCGRQAPKAVSRSEQGAWAPVPKARHRRRSFRKAAGTVSVSTGPVYAAHEECLFLRVSGGIALCDRGFARGGVRL